MVKPHQRLTALITVCLWLLSSTALFFLPAHAQIAAHNAASNEVPQAHQMLQAVDQAHTSEQGAGGHQVPCPNHRQLAEVNTDSNAQNSGSLHGIHCADNCANCAMSSCSGPAVFLLCVARDFVVNGDVKVSFAVFPSVQFLPPDPIYRPPASLVA